MSKEFKVGDIIVGNKEANLKYAITKEGVKCEVLSIRSLNKDKILVKVLKSGEDYFVDSKYFELHNPFESKNREILNRNGIETKLEGDHLFLIIDDTVIAIEANVNIGISSLNSVEDTYCEEIGKAVAYYRTNGGSQNV